MIRLLPQNRWEELTEIFEKEFDGSILPTKDQAFIPAEIDDETGEIRSFVVLEQLWRIGQVWSEDGHPGKLFKFVEANIQQGSVIGIASDVRFETIFTKFKMRRVDGTLYRRDF
jgi:hypothetical protein